MIAPLALALALATPPAEPAAAAPEPTAATTGAPAAGRAAEAGGRGEFARQLERELPPLEVRTFATPSGIEGSVEAAAVPTVRAAEGAEEVEVSLGTGQLLTCTFSTERLDVAGSIWRFGDQAKQGVRLRVATPIDVQVVDGSALVFALYVYEVDGPKGPLAGVAKLAVFAHDAHSFLCVHDEPGFGKSFERIVRGLAHSLRGGGEDERGAARFADVQVMRIDTLKVGYTERLIWERKGGGWVLEQHASQLLPRGPADLFALDSVAQESVDGKDLLEEAAYTHQTNGDLDTRVRLARGKDGKTFSYEGEKDGKELKGSFKTRAGLSTDLWFARRLAAGKPAPKKALVHQAYSHEANPTAALPVSYRLEPAKGPRRAHVELGPMKFSATLDAAGLVEGLEVPVGGTTLTVERVWSRGEP